MSWWDSAWDPLSQEYMTHIISPLQLKKYLKKERISLTWQERLLGSRRGRSFSGMHEENSGPLTQPCTQLFTQHCTNLRIGYCLVNWPPNWLLPTPRSWISSTANWWKTGTTTSWLSISSPWPSRLSRTASFSPPQKSSERSTKRRGRELIPGLFFTTSDRGSEISP